MDLNIDHENYSEVISYRISEIRVTSILKFLGLSYKDDIQNILNTNYNFPSEHVSNDVLLETNNLANNLKETRIISSYLKYSGNLSFKIGYTGTMAIFHLIEFSRNIQKDHNFSHLDSEIQLINKEISVINQAWSYIFDTKKKPLLSKKLTKLLGKNKNHSYETVEFTSLITILSSEFEKKAVNIFNR